IDAAAQKTRRPPPRLPPQAPELPPERSSESSIARTGSAASRTSPWAAFAERNGADSPVSSGPSRGSSSAPSEDGDRGVSAQEDRPEAQPALLFRPGPEEVPELAAASVAQSSSAPRIFSPAPGGLPEDAAADVNSMVAFVLNKDGAFDPQRLFVGNGLLVLSDPHQVEPDFARRFLGADGRTAFDLSVLESAVRGEAILGTPLIGLLPGQVVRSRDAVSRLLVLGFAAGAALVMLLESEQDCELCCDTAIAEARAKGSPSFAGREQL
ncbi:unnamed protein product, partial [Polarella glacialis]